MTNLNKAVTTLGKVLGVLIGDGFTTPGSQVQEWNAPLAV